VTDQVSHPRNNRQSYSSIYFNIQICLIANWKTKKILHRMLASIPWLQSALNFFLNKILSC
jgi:hypothetical protein